MKLILVFVSTLFGLTGCSYQYWDYRSNFNYLGSREFDVTRLQIKQLLECCFDTSVSNIYIEPIMAQNGNKLGVFACNQYSTHFGRVQFFQFENGTVTVLNRDNLDSLQVAIGFFLSKNGFGKGQIRQAKRRVTVAWKVFSTNLF